MKQWLTLLIISTLTLGGCNGMDAKKQNAEEKLPDTTAFQDEFTREFIKSPEEMEDGYYLFESKTGGYTMSFPVNAKMDNMYYERNENYFETLIFGESIENENKDYVVEITFSEKGNTEWIESNLELLAASVKYNGDFKKYKNNNNDIYYAETTIKFNEQENGTNFVYLSFVNSRDSYKSIRFAYISKCLSDTQNCILETEKERAIAKKIVDSIIFNE